MTKTLSEALKELKTLGAKPNLSPTEKEILRHVAGALQAVDERLVALEGEDHSAHAPISDTPQGETAPMSR
jgi:hypothetical protein